MDAAFYARGGSRDPGHGAGHHAMNAVHALLYLIVSLLAVAMVFFTLGAPFVAALEVIIYAGAIMVLFVFVVMMLNLGEHADRDGTSVAEPRIWIGPVAPGRRSGDRIGLSDAQRICQPGRAGHDRPEAGRRWRCSDLI